MLRFRMSDFKQPKPRIVIIAMRRPEDSLYSPLWQLPGRYSSRSLLQSVTQVIILICHNIMCLAYVQNLLVLLLLDNPVVLFIPADEAVLSVHSQTSR